MDVPLESPTTWGAIHVELGKISVILARMQQDMDRAAGERKEVSDKLQKHEVELEQIKLKLDTQGKVLYWLLAFLVAQFIGAMYWYYKVH